MNRVLTVVILIPIIAVLIFLGGWFFTAFMALALGIAAWEFWRIFKNGNYRPSLYILVGGVVALVLSRHLGGIPASGGVLAFLTLAAMLWHIIDYERGATQSAVDMFITIGGLVYLGWLGGYFISVEQLPDGKWWLLVLLPAVWLSDMFAYEIGKRIGKHKFSRRTSPNKTWEGYISGLVSSLIFTPLLAWLWSRWAPAITVTDGVIIALVLGLAGPVGDLGESLIKRQFGVKDSSNLLPGHGGAMDRLDSWLWAVSIGYYLILLLT